MMRANRLMGAALVENNLVKMEDLERANERLLEIVGNGQPRQTTVLGILAYEFKVLREEDVLAYDAEHLGAGAVDLTHYEVPEEFKKDVDFSACWATWSVPFDQVEDFHFVASALLSEPSRAEVLGAGARWPDHLVRHHARGNRRFSGKP